MELTRKQLDLVKEIIKADNLEEQLINCFAN